MEYAESIFITRNNIKLFNELGKTNLEEKDFSKHNLAKFSCFFVETATFKNGYQADIKACTGDIGDSVWCEMVLFDEKGNELSCTDVQETIDGEWKLEYEDDVYTVYIEEITFDEFDWNENAKDFSELEFEIDGKYIVNVKLFYIEFFNPITLINRTGNIVFNIQSSFIIVFPFNKTLISTIGNI